MRIGVKHECKSRKAIHRLICAALKPLGSTSVQLAEMAYRLAAGGVDLIKDDHGLADQPYAPFRERVARCAEAVARANAETGFTTLYAPNVTTSIGRLLDHVYFAKDHGASALLVVPGLTGFDAVRMLADDDSIGLPILSHPALVGSFVISAQNGFSHYALFGQLMRLIGADAVVYPNFGGRFFFSREECAAIVAGCSEPMGSLLPSLPCPG